MKKQQRKTKIQQRIRQRNRNVISVCMLVILIVLLALLFVRGRDSEKEGGNSYGGNSSMGNSQNSGNATNGEQSSGSEDFPNEDSQGNEEEGNVSGNPTNTPEPTPQIQFSNLDSTSAVLVRREDNQVMYALDADRVLYPASMTKIMTALVAIENISNMNDMMKIRQATYDEVYLQGASLAGFPCGVDVPIIDVLYGIMLPSGAECSVAIAEYLYGSEEAFVDVMNEKAKELGMNSTHFVTATGLHDDQHYTTVKDLAKLVQYALENETFKMIYCSKTYTTAPTKKYPQGLTFYNTMFARMGNKKLDNGEIMGGKTGYTSEAGNCLASYAVVDGVEYILVTAGSMDESKKGPVEDAILIYNQIGK